MPFRIADWFGYDVDDWSASAVAVRAELHCPFIDRRCTKTFNDGSVSGVCSVYVGTDPTRPPVVTCPNRLYAGMYFVLQQVAETAFGPGYTIISPDDLRKAVKGTQYVLALGKNSGGEIRLPSRSRSGGYFVDWILARLSSNAELVEFAAVEIQAIDTTGTYRPEVNRLKMGAREIGKSKAGLNWENVNKRILPQLIYKGHVLRRENLCRRGLFFVCPTQVFERVVTRLGDSLLPYTNLQPGSITFLHFGLGAPQAGIRQLMLGGQFSTTIDQVALAFTAPTNLPDAGVYEKAIRSALESVR